MGEECFRSDNMVFCDSVIIYGDKLAIAGPVLSAACLVCAAGMVNSRPRLFRSLLLTNFDNILMKAKLI